MNDRGGRGWNMTVDPDGSWALTPPETDGLGCPGCGAVRNGGHGGNCPYRNKRYDEDGSEWHA